MIINKIVFILLSILCLLFLGLWYLRRVNNIMASSKQTASTSSLAFYASLFKVNVEDIQKNTALISKEYAQAIDDLCAIQKNRLTYADVFGALDFIQSLSRAATWCNVCAALEMVSPNQQIRDAAHTALEQLGMLFVDKLSNNKQLYLLCKRYVDQYMVNDTLSKEQRFFVDHMMMQFERAGLATDEHTFNRIAQLKKELVALGLQFDAAIAQDSTIVTASFDQLKGVRKEILDQLVQNKDNLYELRLDYPTYAEIMGKCTNGRLRETYYKAFNNRAYPVNEKTLQEIIQKRNELARLVGYPSFASFDLADQMVGSVEQATLFLDDLIVRCKPKVTQEFAELKKIQHLSVQWTVDGKLQPWDLDFVQTLYKNTYYDLDPAMIAQYFPVENTIQALLSIYSDFFGITFKQIESNSFWHDSVKIVQVYTQENQTLLGTLLLDLYPRQGKYTHACQMSIIPSFIEQGTKKHCPGLAIVLANFPAPSADAQALLKLADVRTFFHEFGHALHALLGATSVVSLSGTNTKTDFVELPSQLLEEWLWDKDMLKRVSCHYQTAQPLPDDVIERIIGLKHFSTGYFVQRQAYLAKLALHYYNAAEPVDLQQSMQQLYNSIITHVAYPEGTHFYASFGHLYGYGAKYYGYLWSNVFAQDLFTVIKKHGLTSQTIGKKYSALILQPGGTQDPTDMLIAFLGRKPDAQAFFDAMGL
ncbi:hypothetical protein EKK58_01600 [Candidatus Dependentiae bacterium]|nr:MAG: hypothetical protein EKK58_01600 [Candidatus Dependentiae bacterium]